MQAPPRLQTERLELRLLAPAEAPAVAAYFRENREHLRPSGPTPAAEFFTEPYWAQSIVKNAREFVEGFSLRLFLFEKTSTAPLGSISYTNIIRGPFQNCHLGYGLAKRAEGRGYMTEALRASNNYVFEELNLHRISAAHRVDNARSARVLEKLGFVKEGIAKDYLRLDGRWEDHVLTSLTNPAWREK